MKNIGFTNEMGALLFSPNRLLCVVPGEVGHVEFPSETIWKLHKDNPGSVYALSHTHPPQFPELSARDKLTLKTWAFALFPYPARIITISESPSIGSNNYISVIETCYFGILESKEDWIARGKSTPRNFEIIKEWETQHYFDLDGDYGHEDWYGKHLLKKSYGNHNKRHKQSVRSANKKY